MRIRVFSEIEIDEQTMMEAIRSQVPDARPDQIPAYVANVINSFIGQALPGAQYAGSVSIPDLVKPSAIVVPPSGLIVR